MSTPAGGVIGDAEIRVNANTDPAQRALRGFSRDAQGHLRDVRGRFVSESRLINGSLNSISGSSAGVTDALSELRSGALLLSPALIPVAATAASVAASAGAAAIAVGVFGAAVAGQISAISEAAEAEEKYSDAVAEHGARSTQAAQAQNAYVRQIQKMPPATRTAAAALSSLKDQYQDWSDALAADTMPVVTKAFQALGAVFPKLTPLVKGTSKELDRFVTILAGGLVSPGLDRVINQFTEFSTGVLRRANDALLSFIRTANTDTAQSGLVRFLDYVRENGPVVRQTVHSVVQALLNVAEAAANVGPGLLTLISIFADVVAAIPPGVITVMLQLAIAIKAVRIAAAGAAAISVGLTLFAESIGAMRTAAAGATGVLPRLGAAIGAMSRAAKLAIAGTGIGLLIIALTELSESSRKAPPDINLLTTSLAHLGRDGFTSGEAARAFGQDLSGLHESIRSLTDPSTTDDVQQWIVTIGGLANWDSTPVKEAKENLDAVDQSLANLVSSGRPDLAAAALKRLTAAYGQGGRDVTQFTKNLDSYQAALDNAKLEQQLAADAMGLFGQQAQLTSQKLNAQKQSADGLRQAITALNDVNRAGISAQIAFEDSLDASTEAATKLTDVFAASGGQLDLNTDKGRKAATALNDLAAKTDAAANAARESGASWQTVNGIYERGRTQLLKNADQMGLNEKAAKSLADQILKTPDKTAKLRGNIEDLESKLKTAKNQLGKVPDSRRAAIRADISQLETELRSARRQLADIPDKRIGVSIFVKPTAFDRDANGIPDAVQARAQGGLVGYPHGGRVRGPGTSTSDSILARLSNGEFVMRAAAVRQYGLDFMQSLNEGRLGTGAASASSLGVGERGRQTVNVTYAPQINLTNAGVIGSQFEMENWLVRSLDTVSRTGRLPRGLTTAGG
jgi:trimeric autotransporter adhesin